jgi:hypothetical protein
MTVIVTFCLYYYSIPSITISKPEPQTFPANAGASSEGAINALPTFNPPIPKQEPDINETLTLIIFSVVCFVS